MTGTIFSDQKGDNLHYKDVLKPTYWELCILLASLLFIVIVMTLVVFTAFRLEVPVTPESGQTLSSFVPSLKTEQVAFVPATTFNPNPKMEKDVFYDLTSEAFQGSESEREAWRMVMDYQDVSKDYYFRYFKTPEKIKEARKAAWQGRQLALADSK